MMDTEITRYDCYGAAVMLPHTVGDFVLHKDYAALLAKAERLRDAMRAHDRYEQACATVAAFEWPDERLLPDYEDRYAEGTRLRLEVYRTRDEWLEAKRAALRQATGEEGA